MNIYDFFNSPDVAEYCQSLGHKFNAMESAVMINKSNKRTLAEKHAAYRTIIEKYPDMEIPKSRCRHIKSFNKILAEMITYEEQMLEKFLTPEPGAVYRAKLRYKDGRGSWEGELFTTYEKVLADALANALDEASILNRIEKKYPDTGKCIGVKNSPSGEIINIWTSMDTEEFCKKSGLPNDFYDSLLDSFYIDVPVPFKKGDLVEEDDDDCSWMGGIFVLRNIDKNIPGSDTSDMTAYVFYENNGSVGCESTHFYPDLRYCHEELKGEARILKYISLFEQEKICLCTLLNIQNYLFADRVVRKTVNCDAIDRDLCSIGENPLTGLKEKID